MVMVGHFGCINCFKNCKNVTGSLTSETQKDETRAFSLVFQALDDSSMEGPGLLGFGLKMGVSEI